MGIPCVRQPLTIYCIIVIGTIQLGATVDYAILMTNRYKSKEIAGHKKKKITGNKCMSNNEINYH